MKLIILLFISLFSFPVYSNDGAYKGSGNHLTPINEKDISIRKEILTIRLSRGNAEVDVYYEMYNPGKEKTVIVGFETPSPSGDVGNQLVNNGHPYMSGFTVMVNGKRQNYVINYFLDDQEGSYKSVSLPIFEEYISQYDEPNYLLSYVFPAKFKPGINIIKHKYTYDMSGSIMSEFGFTYILTAANRWANNGIDDFTLNIYLGQERYIYISPGFFSGLIGWKIIGKGTLLFGPTPSDEDTNERSLWCFIKKGFVQFKQKNFHPKGELSFGKPQPLWEEPIIDNWLKNNMPYKWSR